jgi:uncharacterized protein YndB with AHSA1/START domain
MGTYTLKAEPGQLKAIMTQVFDAPRSLVFRAYTDRELITQWWGPAEYTTTIDKFEPRSGGSWRFVQRGSKGDTYAFHGVYHEVTAPQRIVQTFEWEGLPGHATFEIATFEEQGGRTTVTSTSIFESVEDRDGMLGAGMEEDAPRVTERMSKLLEKLKKSM